MSLVEQGDLRIVELAAELDRLGRALRDTCDLIPRGEVRKR
jgi:hypothetical protein